MAAFYRCNILMSSNTANKLSEEIALSAELAKIPCKPFVKWVGGKTQLLPELLKRIPQNFNTYYEPFIGGGALFFKLQPKRAHLSDTNPELINAYEVVRDSVEELIIDLARHVYEESYYYTIRDIDRSPEFANWSKVQRASRLIYLNKTCFNGLYRVNSKGHFNTPFGRYSDPKILDADNLRGCSKVLQGISITLAPFEAIETSVNSSDFVYFDPPYVPLNATSNFTTYSKDGFDLEMQKNLCLFCERLKNRNIKFMLSNSSAPIVEELYKQFHVEYVLASRAINSKAEGRGHVKEVIVRNYR